MRARPARRPSIALALLASTLGACDVILSLEGPAPIDAAVPIDAPALDAPLDAPPYAGTAFSAPVILPPFDSVFEEDGPSLTDDLLELYLFSSGQIYVSTRPDIEAAWSAPVVVNALNTDAIEQRPRISGNGLTMYFTRRSARGDDDIYVTTREARGTQDWEPPVLVEGVNTDASEIAGWHSEDGLTLYFDRSTAGDTMMRSADLYIATRASAMEPFTVRPFDALNSSVRDVALWSSADGTQLVFSSGRGGAIGIWEAVRDGDGWNIVPRTELNAPGLHTTPWLSRDGRLIVFSSNRPRGVLMDENLYMATR